MNIYYVDLKIGKDNNKGIFEELFKIIKKVSNIVIVGDNCYIREGVYFEFFKFLNFGKEYFFIIY